MFHAAGIYAIVHIATSRHYVGSSRNVRRRLNAHRHLLRTGKHYSPHLQRAWTMYGEDAFAFCLLEAVECVDDLLQMEQVWIDRLRAGDPTRGFNTAPVAGTRAGVPHSEESRQKMSLAGKGRPKSAEHRAKIGAGNKGKVRSEEVKARIAATVSSQMTPERRKLAADGVSNHLACWAKAIQKKRGGRCRKRNDGSQQRRKAALRFCETLSGVNTRLRPPCPAAARGVRFSPPSRAKEFDRSRRGFFRP